MTAPHNHPRFTQALWYAFGQQDAGIGTEADAVLFALGHATDAENLNRGLISHLSSVQDAWKAYIKVDRELLAVLDEVQAIEDRYDDIILDRGSAAAINRITDGWRKP